MYDHRSFLFEPKLLSEISRRPEHIATSIGYVKKVDGRAVGTGTTCCVSIVPNARGSKSVADVFDSRSDISVKMKFFQNTFFVFKFLFLNFGILSDFKRIYIFSRV